MVAGGVENPNSEIRSSNSNQECRPEDRARNIYDGLVKLSRFLLIVLYLGYLVNAGLMLIILPWSMIWGLLLSRFPLPIAGLLDLPWLRGFLTAFGVLHLMLVAWELFNPTLLTPEIAVQTQSQKDCQS